MRKRLDLRRQEAGESIESFARDIKLIGHRTYPKAADPAMLEHILIKQFVNRLSTELSQERVIFIASKTLIAAAQIARFAESAVRVHKITLPPRLHHVRCQASASEIAGQAVAPVSSPHVATNSRLHVSAAFEAVVEVAQSDVEHSIRSLARQAVDRSSDKVNNKIQ